MEGTRRRVGILGATGAVGQKFVELLDRHPWFEVSAVAASERSVGQPYTGAVNWQGPGEIPPNVAELVIGESAPGIDCDFVFSGLDSSVAGEIESAFADAGYPVISNARNHRMDSAVPLLIPEVNPDHIDLIGGQPWDRGFIVTNPNCSTVGLASTLKPLADAFGLQRVLVTTLQAVSGAGYPGIPSLDILGNVVPYIAGEEEKLESEPRKILGTVSGGAVREAEFSVSAHCNRVPVLDGHTECISVELESRPNLDEISRAFRDFTSGIDSLDLPSARPPFIRLVEDETGPQPRRKAGADGGMPVWIGRLRPCHVLDFRYVVMVHNTIRGAAGGAILNAELLVARGRL